MHKKKRNEMLLLPWLLLSIVGAHRQYSRMFIWFGCFQNRAYHLTQIFPYFCVLTRHFFFQIFSLSFVFKWSFYAVKHCLCYVFFIFLWSKTIEHDRIKIKVPHSIKSKTDRLRKKKTDPPIFQLHAQEFPLLLRFALSLKLFKRMFIHWKLN